MTGNPAALVQRANTWRLRPLAALAVGYLVVTLLLLEVLPGPVYALTVVAVGLGLVLVGSRIDRSVVWLRLSIPHLIDVAAVLVLYAIVVGLFRLAFGVFGTDNVAGLFLTFAGGLLIGVGGPIAHVVGIRRDTLASLGLGRQRLRETVLLGVVLAALQAVLTLPKVDFPAPEAWIPLLVMAVAVGFFEALFFRGYVLAVMEPAFGLVPAVAASAGLYAVYHVGYGMGGDEMLFLAGLGILYATAFVVVRNILVLWPLLTPVGGFFANLQAGDVELPLEAVLGFAWLLVGMMAIVYAAYRRTRRRLAGGTSRAPAA